MRDQINQQTINRLIRHAWKRWVKRQVRLPMKWDCTIAHRPVSQHSAAKSNEHNSLVNVCWNKSRSESSSKTCCQLKQVSVTWCRRAGILQKATMGDSGHNPESEAGSKLGQWCSWRLNFCPQMPPTGNLINLSLKWCVWGKSAVRFCVSWEHHSRPLSRTPRAENGCLFGSNVTFKVKPTEFTSLNGAIYWILCTSAGFGGTVKALQEYHHVPATSSSSTKNIISSTLCLFNLIINWTKSLKWLLRWLISCWWTDYVSYREFHDHMSFDDVPLWLLKCYFTTQITLNRLTELTNPKRNGHN